jgi:predicted nucleotidyltransferase
MGTRPSRAAPKAQRSLVADALFPKTRQRVLGVLFGTPHQSFYANEIIALAESGTGAVQRELDRFEKAGLVTVKRVGKQKHYQADASAAVYPEIRALVLKTSGLADILRAALKPREGDLHAAFVFGSIPKNEDTAQSDVDLMVVSDILTYPDIISAVGTASHTLGRQINPTVYTRAELARRIRERNAFVKRVLAQPKLWLIGDERELTV